MTARCVTVLLVVLLGIQVTPARAQSGSSENALLQEVRLLRQAIEQLAGTNARVQIVFGRLQLQDQRTAKTAGRLEEARGALSRIVGEVSRVTEQLQRYEAMDPTGLGQKEREQLPAMIRELKVQLQVLETDRLRLATQEADAANQLALDQNTWNDLNRSLDDLERSLTQPRKQ